MVYFDKVTISLINNRSLIFCGEGQDIGGWCNYGALFYSKDTAGEAVIMVYVF